MPTAPKVQVKIRPLHDRILVKRIEERRRRTAASSSPTPRRRSPRRARSSRSARASVTEDGKMLPLDVKVGDRILFGKYSGSEIKIDGDEYLIMREDDDPRRPRLARSLAATATMKSRTQGGSSWQPKQIVFSDDARAGDPARRQPAGRRREGHARPEGPQRRPRQEVRRPDHHQGRRDRRQGDRARRTPSRTWAPRWCGGRLQDLRRRRRRHHDRHRAGPGDLPRGPEERGRRREPDGR